jgi:cell division protein FtsB
MAAAPNARPAPRRDAQRHAARPRAVAGGQRRGAGIRWDRVSRVAMLFVLVGILILYIGPVRSYFATRHRAAAQSAVVRSLRQENTRLRERRNALSHPATLEREARRLGMLRPGEKPFVVRGLPKGP